MERDKDLEELNLEEEMDQLEERIRTKVKAGNYCCSTSCTIRLGDA